MEDNGPAGAEAQELASPVAGWGGGSEPSVTSSPHSHTFPRVIATRPHKLGRSHTRDSLYQCFHPSRLCSAPLRCVPLSFADASYPLWAAGVVGASPSFALGPLPISTGMARCATINLAAFPGCRSAADSKCDAITPPFSIIPRAAAHLLQPRP
jgi:hypothetical protein